MKRLLTPENILNLLLVFVPIAIVLETRACERDLIFITSCLAIIPLAGLMGKATEHLAEKVGEGIGGLLNATFGNAAELIIAIVALRAGLYDVVKASITGSIIGNILLVFGLSALLGGLKFPSQTFNKTAASLGTTMLTLSVIGLVVPALYPHRRRRHAGGRRAGAEPRDRGHPDADLRPQPGLHAQDAQAPLRRRPRRRRGRRDRNGRLVHPQGDRGPADRDGVRRPDERVPRRRRRRRRPRRSA